MALGHSPKITISGLVAYWDAGNTRSYSGSGTTWNDLSGNSLTMTTFNTPTFSSGSFAFNGSTQYATATNSTLLDNQTFTISVWVKTNATTQQGFWFEKGTVNTQYSFFQQGSFLSCRVNTGTLVDTINITTSTYMNTSNWYNGVFTFTSGSQVLYINGAVVGTGATTGTVATNAGGMSIGAYGGQAGAKAYFFNGSIASVKVYNRVLTSTEVAQNFNALRGRFGI